MSSFKATFTVNGNDYDILSCGYALHQAIDDRGRPASGVQAGGLQLVIVASDDEELPGWMVDPYKKTNGSITFQRIDQDSKLKEIKFEDGYCVSYSEHFNSSSSEPMTVSLNISARTISIGSVKHEVKW
jgi:hypothetical protein